MCKIMKVLFKAFSLSILISSFLLINSAMGQSPVSEFALEYRKTATADKRLSLCIEAINRKLIYPGMSLSELNALFGTDYHLEAEVEGLPTGRKGAINFVPAVDSPRDDMAAGVEGWYLAFFWGKTGYIENYYITNIH